MLAVLRGRIIGYCRRTIAGGAERIGSRTLIAYSQAQLGLNFCATLLGLHLLYFYIDRRGLSPALAGLAYFIALALDGLTDPLVGNLSDRARFRSGRRRPFFLSAVPMGLCGERLAMRAGSAERSASG